MWQDPSNGCTAFWEYSGNRSGVMQGCAGIAALVLPSVGLDCASVKQAVQRIEAAAAARGKGAARMSLLHLAVRSRSPALVRIAGVAPPRTQQPRAGVCL